MCNKIKHTCGDTTYADCVVYEGSTNQLSELNEQSCISIEDTTQDIYNQLEEINLSSLGDKCLEYVTGEDNKIIVKNVLLKFEEEICSLKEKAAKLESTEICDKNITECGLDFSCLTLPCDSSIVTVKDLFQALINKVCE